MRMKPCKNADKCLIDCRHREEHEYAVGCVLYDNRDGRNCPICEPVEALEVITHTAAEVIRELERMLTPEYADNDEGIIEHTGDWILLDSQLKRLKEKYLNQEAN